MNDFDYDCMQKKRIAMGAFAHINRKRGGCALPSDTLTEKQRKEKNGEVKSYNITRPMPWHEFKAMPDDLKREFFRNMQSFGHTVDAQSEEHAANDAPPKADKPQTGVKLLHARLEMSGDREALLANLRVLLPDEGRVTVEW